MSNPQEDSLKVAYVVPMGNGLHSFVFREIRELRSCGVDIHFQQRSETGRMAHLSLGRFTP